MNLSINSLYTSFQLLHIGGYYIIEHNAKDCFSATNDAAFGSSGSANFLIDSGKHIWSLAFISDDAFDGVRPKVQIQQQLLSSNDDSSSVCSDVCLYLPINLTGLLEDIVTESEDAQIQKFEASEIWANFCSEPQSSNCVFPEGKLISLKGNVVGIHDISSGFCNSCSSGASLDGLQMKGLVGDKGSFCIHVLVHHNIVSCNCNAILYILYVFIFYTLFCNLIRPHILLIR